MSIVFVIFYYSVLLYISIHNVYLIYSLFIVYNLTAHIAHTVSYYILSHYLYTTAIHMHIFCTFCLFALPVSFSEYSHGTSMSKQSEFHACATFLVKVNRGCLFCLV